MYESVLRLQGAQQALSDTSDCKLSPKVNGIDDSYDKSRKKRQRADLKLIERSVETRIRVK